MSIAALRRVLLPTSIFVLALLAACQSTPSAPKTPPKIDVTGSRIIACCCPSPCPCRLNLKPTNCHGCDHTDAVHVDHGTINGVAMDGVTWVFVGRGFGQDLNGNWAYVYVSDNASDAQYKALGDMLNNDVKGLGKKAAYLAGKFVGMRKVPMTYTISADRKEYDTVIPGVLELRTHAIYNPGHITPVVSTGIMDAFGDRFVHADCLAHRFDDKTIGYKWDLTGRQCNQADFVLNDARIAQGGIGWGCWTAHADFGDKQPYGEQLIGHDGTK